MESYTYNSPGWEHWAVISSAAGLLRVLVNGNQIGDQEQFTGASRSFSFGMRSGNASFAQNYYDEIRVSTIDRYAAGWSQQTVEWEPDEYTLALLHINGNFNDSSLG